MSKKLEIRPVVGRADFEFNRGVKIAVAPLGYKILTTMSEFGRSLMPYNLF